MAKKLSGAAKALIAVLVVGGVVGAAAAITKGFKEIPRVGLIDEVTSKEKVFSVEFKDGEVEGTRMDDAVNLKAGINGETNNFDHIFPWSDMKTVKDSNGDVFVKIPKFYEKIEFTEEGKKISITGKERKGFHVHPAFIKGEAQVDEIQIGAYEASFTESGALASVADATPAGDKTLDEFRTLAEADGNMLFDWRQNQALQSLFAVEFATLDSQSVMRGGTEYVCLYGSEEDDGNECKYSVSTDEICKFEDTKLVDIAKVGANVFCYYNGDETIVLGNRKISEIKYNSGKTAVTSITLDEALDLEEIEDFDIENLYFDVNGLQKTGSTAGRRGSSNGSATEAIAMNYRGIENWYGSSWTWVDGLYTIKTTEEAEDEDDDPITHDMIAVSMDATKNGDRSSYKMFAKADVTNKVSAEGIYLQDVSATDAEDYFNLNFNSTASIGYVGGGYCGHVIAGAFSTNICNSLDSAYSDYGVRLSYIPH